jgi:hypothetical protein
VGRYELRGFEMIDIAKMVVASGKGVWRSGKDTYWDDLGKITSSSSGLIY